MGLWYGAEIITHHENEAYETVYDSCVVVHLADVNEVSSVHNLNMSRHHRNQQNLFDFWHFIDWFHELRLSVAEVQAEVGKKIEMGQCTLKRIHSFHHPPARPLSISLNYQLFVLIEFMSHSLIKLDCLTLRHIWIYQVTQLRSETIKKATFILS